MIAQLKYGSGMPFYRLEQMERHLGIPRPAATPHDVAYAFAGDDQAGMIMGTAGYIGDRPHRPSACVVCGAGFAARPAWGRGRWKSLSV